MPRNLDRRVEILFPVDDPRLRQAIVQDILAIHFQDNVQARRSSHGSYDALASAAQHRRHQCPGLAAATLENPQ